MPSSILQLTVMLAAVARIGFALKSDGHRDRNAAKLDTTCMCDVVKVVAETAANSKRQQLRAVEPETATACATLLSVDDYCMRAGQPSAATVPST
jgi:hypothetical protein